MRRHSPAQGWETCSAPSARIYAATFARLLSGLYEAVVRDLVARTAQDPPNRILDVGAGPGDLVVALARALPEARLTALDVDPRMVEAAAARARWEGLTDRVGVLAGDVAALSVPDASIDLVTSTLSVHHWPDARAGFAEVRRVLRPGGRAIVYDLPDWWGHVETRAPGLLTAARGGGLRDLRAGRLAWPGRLRLVQRVEGTR